MGGGRVRLVAARHVLPPALELPAPGRRVGGTLAAEVNGVVDCIEGASARLTKDGRTVAETTSDNYGDFKFDKLDEDSGRYLLEISAPGRAKKTIEAKLGASVNLGEIRL